MIMVQSELLPADLPVPPEAQGVEYATSLKRLDFTTSTAPEAVMEFYRTAVPGWTTGMKEARQEDAKEVLAFRNAQNDLIVLSLTSDSSGGTRATLEFQSAEEIAEMNRRLDAQAEAYKKKQAQESASSNAPQSNEPLIPHPHENPAPPRTPCCRSRSAPLRRKRKTPSSAYKQAIESGDAEALAAFLYTKGAGKSRSSSSK